MSNDTDVATGAHSDLPPAAAITQPVAPQIGTGSGVNARSEIWQFLIAQTRCPPLPTKWRAFGQSTSIRQLLTTPAELQRALCARFSADELVAAGVLRRATGSALTLSPVIGNSESSFLILGGPDGEPIDAISSRGQLSHGTKPVWLAEVDARHEQWQTYYVKTLLIADNDDDMTLMHRFGFRSVPAAGLECLSGDNLRSLWRILGTRANNRKFTLTLPAWQIARFSYEPAPETLKTLQHLSEIPYLLGHEPPPFQVWLPSREEFKGFRRARKLGDRTLISRLLSESLGLSQCTVKQALVAIGDRAELDYINARRRLAVAIRRSTLVPHCAEVKVALAQLEKAFDKLIVTPFMGAELDRHNVWERWPMLAAGEIALEWFNHLDVVVAARTILSGQYPIVNEDGFYVRERLVSSYAKLRRVRGPC